MENVEIKEKLQKENCMMYFSDVDEMQNGLDTIMQNDDWETVYTSRCRADMDGEGGAQLTTDVEASCAGLLHPERKTFPLFKAAERTLSERSGSDATGNKWLTFEERLGVMNTYFAHHPEKERSKILVRGGHILAMHSMQYKEIPQARLFTALKDGLNHPHFMGGTYTHERTRADFILPEGISKDYIDAWTRAGLPKNVLAESHVKVVFLTNDVGTNTAEIVLMMLVKNCPYMIGEPIRVMHRKGSGDLDAFKKQVASIDITIEKEMSVIAKLMGIRIRYPKAVMLRAMKEVRLPKIAKKACQEVLSECMYTSGVSAYMLYLSINGIVDTAKGKEMSEDRKFQMLSAIRRLLKYDWEAADKPGETELY